MNSELHVLFLCGWYPSRVSPTNGDFIERHAEAVSQKHKVSILHIITDINLAQDIEINSEKKKGFNDAHRFFEKNEEPN